ncbi:hypothetical protein HDU76_008774, partial [Blyttiomyces sp. JEL0837]
MNEFVQYPPLVGYKVAALNNVTKGKGATSKDNPIKPIQFDNDPLPPEFPNKLSDPVSQRSESSGSTSDSSFKQLSRFTLIVDDHAANYNLTASNPKLQSYDLLAVQPTTEKSFQMACNQYDIDIISLDFGSRLPFYLKATTVNMAIQRGICFEICYGGAIRDSTARRNIIANAAALMRVTNGKNVILTSEAMRAMEVRGPFDVINLNHATSGYSPSWKASPQQQQQQQRPEIGSSPYSMGGGGGGRDRSNQGQDGRYGNSMGQQQQQQQASPNAFSAPPWGTDSSDTRTPLRNGPNRSNGMENANQSYNNHITSTPPMSMQSPYFDYNTQQQQHQSHIHPPWMPSPMQMSIQLPPSGPIGGMGGIASYPPPYRGPVYQQQPQLGSSPYGYQSGSPGYGGMGGGYGSPLMHGGGGAPGGYGMAQAYGGMGVGMDRRSLSPPPHPTVRFSHNSPVNTNPYPEETRQTRAQQYAEELRMQMMEERERKDRERALWKGGGTPEFSGSGGGGGGNVT